MYINHNFADKNYLSYHKLKIKSSLGAGCGGTWCLNLDRGQLLFGKGAGIVGVLPPLLLAGGQCSLPLCAAAMRGEVGDEPTSKD